MGWCVFEVCCPPAIYCINKWALGYSHPLPVAKVARAAAGGPVVRYPGWHPTGSVTHVNGQLRPTFGFLCLNNLVKQFGHPIIGDGLDFRLHVRAPDISLYCIPCIPCLLYALPHQMFLCDGRKM